jgi:beta-lactamase superfamily II metal-dependent hydrolase
VNPLTRVTAARCALLGLASSIALLYPSTAGVGDPPLRITFLALDRGEATLVQAPGGVTGLIGAGAAGEGEKVLQFLRSRKVSRLDVLAASTWSPEHMGGMPRLIKSLPVKRFIHNSIYAPVKGVEPLLELIRTPPEQSRIPAGSMTPGEAVTLHYTPPCIMRAVAPTGPMLTRFAGDRDCSLMLEFRYDRVTYLDLGQTTRRHQQAMWSGVDLKPYGHVLRIGRNGGAGSLTDSLLKPLKTRIAVIPVARKSGKKPAPATLAALRKAGVKVYRTDQHGTITVSTDGDKINVRTGR